MSSPGKSHLPPPGQVAALLRAAEVDDPDFAVLLLVAATTGARRSELCALRWSDIDLEGGTVEFSRVMVAAGAGTWTEQLAPLARQQFQSTSAAPLA